MTCKNKKESENYPCNLQTNNQPANNNNNNKERRNKEKCVETWNEKGEKCVCVFVHLFSFLSFFFLAFSHSLLSSPFSLFCASLSSFFRGSSCLCVCIHTPTQTHTHTQTRSYMPTHSKILGTASPWCLVCLVFLWWPSSTHTHTHIHLHFCVCMWMCVFSSLIKLFKISIFLV